MSKFIKFKDALLNTNDIHKILIHPNKYDIFITGKKFNGFIGLFAGFGFGKVTSYYDIIEVCEFNDSIDYELVSKWIKGETK